jgi:hypothetical protein
MIAIKQILSRCTLLVCCLWIAPLQAGLMDSFNERMIDPEDGKLDLSNYLKSADGFLPVPIIITEPAVGFGLGAAVAYFHDQKELDPEEHTHKGPPSISVVFGAKTENGTYFYGGAHSGSWKDDHIRYLGAVAKMNVNMTWYPFTQESDTADDTGFKFNVEGNLLLQEMQFRLKESNWWLGANYTFVTAENTFKVFEDDDIPLPDPQFDFHQGSLSAFVEFDDRNTTFTPSKGIRARLEVQSFDETWGGDFDYTVWKGKIYHYTPVGDYSSLGLRLVGERVSGEAPFFGYPFVDLRGIPALRYQGQGVITAEAEYLWGITPRWSLVFFGGAGHTSDGSGSEGSSRTVAAGGLGFRYRLARAFGLQAGLDVARGPEDSSIYLTFGSAWR